MSILITGGSKGIGRAIAERFSTEGEMVFINYSSDDSAAYATAESVAALGGDPILLKRDISTAQACAELIEDVQKHTDHLGQVVHGAVVPIIHPVLEISPEDFRRAVDLNGSALLWLVQAAQPLLGRGSSIFFLSSRGSKLAVKNYAAIGAPKALAEALIRYLAVDLAPLGIRANIVSASGVLTDAIRAVIPDADEHFSKSAALNPSGRNLDLADIANAVAWLASDEAEMITGRELFLDGGLYTQAS